RTANTEHCTSSLHDALPISGAPTGYLLELAAMDLVYHQAPTESIEERVDRLYEVLHGMAESGLTGTHVMDFHPGSQEILERYEADRKSTRLNSSHVSISYAV